MRSRLDGQLRPAGTLAVILLGVGMVFSTDSVGTDAEDASCTATECHSELHKRKHVHGPVALDRCSACHTPRPGGTPLTSGERHRFDPVADDAHLCFECHAKIGDKSFVHEPIKKRMCVICHDPHGSDNAFFLRVSPVGDLCLQCHTDTMREESEVHGPVAVGQCTACHDPHESDNPYRLHALGPESCFTCHREKQREFGGKEFHHQPILEDCGKCHDPHDSPFAYRLRDEVPGLCLGCHTEMGEHLGRVAVKHGAIEAEGSCLNCHNPHASDYPKNLRDVPMGLCMQCHDRTVETPTGRVRNMKALLETHEFHHGPIREGDCTACHNPHGDDNWRMLRQYFPSTFYSPFGVDSYELCFACHQPTLALQAETDSLTGFRNGTRNLHFVHVNKEEKGRTCRACHDFHATSDPKMITAASQFGDWALPISYEKTETGGSCAPGCHLPRGYDRVKEVINER